MLNSVPHVPQFLLLFLSSLPPLFSFLWCRLDSQGECVLAAYNDALKKEIQRLRQLYQQQQLQQPVSTLWPPLSSLLLFNPHQWLLVKSLLCFWVSCLLCFLFADMLLVWYLYYFVIHRVMPQVKAVWLKYWNACDEFSILMKITLEHAKICDFVVCSLSTLAN